MGEMSRFDKVGDEASVRGGKSTAPPTADATAAAANRPVDHAPVSSVALPHEERDLELGLAPEQQRAAVLHRQPLGLPVPPQWPPPSTS